MSVELFQVDAFTAEPFAGNPAAVCLLREPASPTWMQQVAREMNLSETAFIQRRSDDLFDLRWFTPAVEVDLCGHATLAGAHVLWEAGWLDQGREARFQTRSGLLTATWIDPEIELDFPSQEPAPADAPAGLVEALGIEPRWIGRNRTDYLIEVASEAEVRAMRPDFRRLAEVSMRGVMVTAGAQASSPSAGEPYDFVSRFFAPAAGIDEDPVTGSAHCCLGPFWGARTGRDVLTGFQASARGGFVRVALSGERVRLAGRAVTVLRGQLQP